MVRGSHMNWEEVPRWQRLGFLWAAFLLALALCIKSDAREGWLIMSLSLLSGRVFATLHDPKADARESDSPTSVFGDR